MNDPGANLRGTVSLSSIVGDPESGVATTTYQRSPAGQNTWTAAAASWDTTAVADGLYDLRVVVTNGAGTTTSSSIVANRRVDNTAPTATMDNPGTPIAGTVTLTSTAGDGGSGLSTATFQYSTWEAGLGRRSTPTRAVPFSINWDTTAVTDGRYSLRVIVTDVAGNSTTSSTVTNRKISEPPAARQHHVTRELHRTRPLRARSRSRRRQCPPAVPADNVEFFRCDDASANCSTGNFDFDRLDFTPLHGRRGCKPRSRREPGR